jgi:hypothetical protein
VMLTVFSAGTAGGRQALANFEKAAPGEEGVQDCLGNIANIAMLRGDLGSRNEKLVEFGIKPLRTRRRRQPANPPPLNPEISVPQPE